MKTTKLMVVALSLGLAFGATTKVGLQNAAISTDGLSLTIESNQDVHGIQFDLKYDPSELTFNGAESLLDDFTFEYKEREAGDVRGLMFSMQGKKINMDNVTSAIKFNFEGQGTVDFDNVICHLNKEDHEIVYNIIMNHFYGGDRSEKFHFVNEQLKQNSKNKFVYE